MCGFVCVYVCVCFSAVKLRWLRVVQVNFVYGEIDAISVAHILEFIQPRPGQVLVDLGSGNGKVVLAAAMLYPELKACRGIELMVSFLDTAREADAILTGAQVVPAR